MMDFYQEKGAGKVMWITIGGITKEGHWDENGAGKGEKMKAEEFRATLGGNEPPVGLPAPMEALWWDAQGDWARAHGLVDELETAEGMAVHAYLHRKEGEAWNADYWYKRAGDRFRRETLEAEWEALVEGLN
jgi:hypothetical protein